jgi:hypothetical protein
MTFTSTGVTFNDTSTRCNANSYDYIYLAIAKEYTEEKTEYTVEFADQGENPSDMKLANKMSIADVATEAFDGSTITKTYTEVEDAGRAIKYGIQADKDVEVQQINIAMTKGE